MKLYKVNAGAHTVAMLTFVLPYTMATMATTTMQRIGKEDQWQIVVCSYQLSDLHITGK